MTSLLARREAVIWTVLFVIVAAWLVAIGFTSDDPDSALYAELSARLAAGPPSRWIAPEWWGQWDSEGLFREHPAGVFFLPTIVGALGVPGVQAAYIVGILAALASVFLIAHLVSGVTDRADARAVLVCLQLMPLASIFRIRSNHEYPMLVCLLVALVGADLVRRSWRWVWVMPLALTAALLVKGVFVLVPIIAVSLWILLNPRQESGPIGRPVLALVLSAGLMAATAQIYDAVYFRVTGEAFWGPYWARQLAPLTIATPADGGSDLAHHIGFYAVRLLWHPAPWSMALLAVAWRHRGSLVAGWRRLPARIGRALLFALGSAAAIVLLLTPASRFAERYIFSANYLVATAGIVVALHQWPRLARTMADLDRRVPALAAWTWFVLMALRLMIGPFLPRISG